MNDFTSTDPVAPTGPGVLPLDPPSKQVRMLGALSPRNSLEKERLRNGRSLFLSSPTAGRSQKCQPSALSPVVGRAEFSKSVLLLRRALARADSARGLSNNVSAATAVEDLVSCTAIPETTLKGHPPTWTCSNHNTEIGCVESDVKVTPSRIDLSEASGTRRADGNQTEIEPNANVSTPMKETLAQLSMAATPVISMEESSVLHCAMDKDISPLSSAQPNPTTAIRATRSAAADQALVAVVATTAPTTETTPLLLAAFLGEPSRLAEQRMRLSNLRKRINNLRLFIRKAAERDQQLKLVVTATGVAIAVAVSTQPTRGASAQRPPAAPEPLVQGSFEGPFPAAASQLDEMHYAPTDQLSAAAGSSTSMSVAVSTQPTGGASAQRQMDDAVTAAPPAAPCSFSNTTPQEVAAVPECSCAPVNSSSIATSESLEAINQAIAELNTAVATWIHSDRPGNREMCVVDSEANYRAQVQEAGQDLGLLKAVCAKLASQGSGLGDSRPTGDVDEKSVVPLDKLDQKTSDLCQHSARVAPYPRAEDEQVAPVSSNNVLAASRKDLIPISASFGSDEVRKTCHISAGAAHLDQNDFELKECLDIEQLTLIGDAGKLELASSQNRRQCHCIGSKKAGLNLSVGRRDADADIMDGDPIDTSGPPARVSFRLASAGLITQAIRYVLDSLLVCCPTVWRGDSDSGLYFVLLVAGAAVVLQWGVFVLLFV
jgi:hypothetical protein